MNAMKISRISEVLGVLVNVDDADPDIKLGCGCDLMSDVLAGTAIFDLTSDKYR
jgi:hypothetical protein